MNESIEKSERIDVLLVDDRPENLLSLEEVLAAPDLNFIRATSGEEALDASLNGRPALIILDVNMPGMSGFDVARLLRGMERTRNIPIIFVTATHREERFSFEGFETGGVDYLFKPLNPVVVQSKVRVFVELHRQSIRLERSLHELSLINSELETFSYSVSHDLRAPVRAVIGFAKNALESKDPNQMKKNLESVFSAGTRMNSLIDALLDLAQFTSMDLLRTKVDLSQLAHEICEELKSGAGGRSVQFEVAKDLKVFGDRRMLGSVLRNLLGNAFKFTSKSSNAHIEFGTYQKQNDTVYFVRDNGAGFDMEFADHLFGAFQRLHSAKDYEGTGVGLATVRRIIHRHRGNIWAESKKNQGATFHFTIGS